MKGVSAVIAAILMLMITIALGGSAYYVFSNTFGGKTEAGFTVVGKSQNTITIRNEGTMPITKNMVSIVVDGAQAVIEDLSSLVGYWKVDEGSGDTIKDSSGNNNDGTLKNFNFDANSGWADGKYGKALRFDAINDYVEVPASSNFYFTGDYTVEVWVKPDNPTLIGFWLTNSNNYISASGGFSFWQDEGRVSFHSGVQYIHSQLASGMSAGNWYHWVATRSGDSNKLYKNGVLFNTVTNTDIVGSSTNVLRIGNLRNSNGDGYYHYKGLLDEVRIYNRELSPEEVKSLYECNEIICIMPKKTGTVRILNPLYAGKHDVEICVSNTCVRDTITTN